MRAGKDKRRLISRYAVAGALGAAALIMTIAIAIATARAQNGSSGPSAGAEEDDSPPTSIEPAPDSSGAPAAPEPSSASAPESPPPATSNGSPAPAPAVKAAATAPHFHPLTKFEVEPVAAKLKVVKTVWIYASPTTADRKVEHVEAGTEVSVTGATHRWLRLKLHDGRSGYIEQSAVAMVKPADKLFVLTHDTAVRADPTRWGAPIAEVHKGHNVQVVGVSLNYLKIKMRNGREGYVVDSAFE